VPQRGTGLAVVLIDRLLDLDTGRTPDITAVPVDEELVEHRQRARLAGTRGHTAPQSPLLGQELVGVLRCRLPQRAGHRPGELDHDGSTVADMPVAQTRSHHRQRVLVDQLLLEVLNILRRRQRIRGRAAWQHAQAHQTLSSPMPTTSREYTKTIRKADR